MVQIKERMQFFSDPSARLDLAFHRGLYRGAVAFSSLPDNRREAPS
jgi:hypothetical protein